MGLEYMYIIIPSEKKEWNCKTTNDTITKPISTVKEWLAKTDLQLGEVDARWRRYYIRAGIDLKMYQIIQMYLI